MEKLFFTQVSECISSNFSKRIKLLVLLEPIAFSLLLIRFLTNRKRNPFIPLAQRTQAFVIHGMHCAGCEAVIENAIRQLPKILAVSADYTCDTLNIHFQLNTPSFIRNFVSNAYRQLSNPIVIGLLKGDQRQSIDSVQQGHSGASIPINPVGWS
ncbi:MAG: heavy-metal-associated domain-containing protein [Methylococcaceae bacterium]|nr:heavy-metal-associated domain-containing protein [Methylococcaceae bacterium]